MASNKNPFETERSRSNLATRGDFKKLRVTYKPSLPEVKDINKGNFWDIKLMNKKKGEDGPIAEDKNNIVYRKVKNFKGKLLNVGFGLGHFEKKLDHIRGIKFFGIDISKYAIRGAKKKLKGTFRVGDILKIPHKDNYFDIVVSLEVLEHIPPSKTFKALGELNRVLKVGGALIVSVPLNEGLEEMVKRGINPSGHVRVYTPELILAELEIAGFKIKEKVFLYAFRNMYYFKKLLQKTILRNRWKPNNMIIFAEK